VKCSEFERRFAQCVNATGLRPVPLGMGAKNKTFFRKLEELALMLILESSKGRVTASWFVGVSFAWGYVPVGVPSTAYERIPALLSLAERAELIGAEDCVAEGFDHWWSGLNEESLHSLCKAVSLTESRFIAAAPLVELRRSPHYKEHRELLSRIRALVPHGVPKWEELALPATLEPWLHATQQVRGGEPDVRGKRSRTIELAEDAALCAAVGLI